jgi:hypothetical protein
MLDSYPLMLNGDFESSESLLLHAIWCLEDLSEFYERKASRLARTWRSSSGSSTESIAGQSIQKALKNISQLHQRVYKGEFWSDSNLKPSSDEFDRSYSKKTVKHPRLLWREDALGGRRGLDPRLQQLQPLHDYNILKLGRCLGSSIIQTRFFESASASRWRNNSSLPNKRPVCPKIAFDIAAIEAVSQMLTLQLTQVHLVLNHKSGKEILDTESISNPMDQDPKTVPKVNTNNTVSIDKASMSNLTSLIMPPSFYQENSKYDEATLKINSDEQDSLEGLVSGVPVTYFHFTTIDLIPLLRQLRIHLETRYETEVDGVPSELVCLLHSFEIMHGLKRHPSTNSLWNIDHQEVRFEVFEARDVGVMYRQKCFCEKANDPGVTEDSMHYLDLFCPRHISHNISSVTNDLQWDETENEWRKNKTKRPPSPVSVGAETDDSESHSGESVDSVMQEEIGMGGKATKDATKKAAIAKESIEHIMNLVGVQNAKSHICKLKSMVETSTRQGVDLKEERFGTVFLGNTVSPHNNKI